MDAGERIHAFFPPRKPRPGFLKDSRITCVSPPVTPPYNTHTHTHSSSTVMITVTHTSSTHTNINHCCSLEEKPAVYFPQGNSSTTVSAQHPHWVNVASHPETQKSTLWVCVFEWLCIFASLRCVNVLCIGCIPTTVSGNTWHPDILK